jgi:hypothetical protein
MTPVKSVSEKMGIKNGSRALLVDAPQDAVKALALPSLDISQHVRGGFDYIHLFSKTIKSLHKHFTKLKAHLNPAGSLWVSWPKAGQQNTDLNIKTVIKIGYDYGLVESKALSINNTWSALKFTHPKPGKKYNNSYGKLK